MPTYLENGIIRCLRCHCHNPDILLNHARYCEQSPNFDDGNRYKIVRMYFDKPGYRRMITNNLTLKQAQEYCKNPETSSSTCTSAASKRVTRRNGQWFDGYEKE